MGTLRGALICGYYDETLNYIVEMNVVKVLPIEDYWSVEESYVDYKNFLTDMTTKIKLYELLKFEFTKGLTPECKEFVVELKGLDK